MGTVCEAILHGPAGFTKRVALKQLKTGGSGLVHEAKLGGLLQHPNLVEVYALEKVGERWVAAMEFVAGGSLDRYIPMPSRAVIETGIGVARGLAHAHEAVGLVHLDLKPANLLLHHGTVKVGDLGISQARGFTKDGGSAGTPTYMAPEQRARHTVDARTDIYTLGVVLLELATGNPARDPELVSWLAPVLARCLAERPEERFSSMREVAAALLELPVSGPGLADLSAREAPPSVSSQSVDTFLFDGPGSEPTPQTTNIPGEPDTYVGREREVAQLVTLLRTPGMVTLKGIGGLGKTRLARRAARQWREHTLGEAWFADLSACSRSDQVVRHVADALGILLTSEDEDAQVEQVGWALKSRGDLVLVLDNFEQVREAASVAVRWAGQAPRLRLLVTSREPLRTAHEQVVQLEPLTLEESVELLVDRARAKGRHVDGDPALPELARRLDCIPLALELAAGRFGLLSVRDMVDRLDERLQLLRSRSSATSHRQDTLRGALDWSWDLLSREEQSAFAQCAVFEDGFTVEAAEAILDVRGVWALDVVESLIDKSLVHTRGDGRLAMYESTRLYARERLLDPYEVEQRHARFFAELGRTARAQHHTNALGPELGNLLAAVRRSLGHGWNELALGCVAGAAQVVIHRGPVGATLDLAMQVADLGLDADDRLVAHQLAGELSAVAGNNAVARLYLERAVQWTEEASPDQAAAAWVGVASAQRVAGEMDVALASLETARSLAQTDMVRGYIELEAGTIAYQRGDYDEGVRAFEAIRALGAHPPHPAAGEALASLAHIHADRGHIDLARSTYRRALAQFRAHGARAFEAATLSNLGNMDLEQGQFDAAERYYTAALTMQRQDGQRRREAVSRSNLGSMELRRGKLEEAQLHFEQALAIHRDVGNRRSEGVCLGNLGTLHHARRHYAPARRAYERARDLAHELGISALEGVWSGELGMLLLERGYFAEAREQLDQSVALLDGRMATYEDLFTIGLGEVRQATEDATDDLAPPLERLRKLGATPTLVRALASLSRRAARRLDVEEAEHWLAEAQSTAASLHAGGQPHTHALEWAEVVLAGVR
ncbi:MAG: tetratricopeptide repeat protein [Deltaproteobacteria bacterium]|nr:MAG: tetratricopeptide repeat protein [Deltaproteobacteria bacterium]